MAEVRANALGALAAVVAAVVVTAAAQVYADLQGASFGDLSRDAAAALGGPNYTGYYAMFTLLVWAAAASVTLFSSVVLRRAHEQEGARFLLFGGLITTLMVLDDAFLLHETVGYRLGDHQEIFFVIYGLATAVFAWIHRRRLGPALVLLVAAFAMWLASAAVDFVMHADAPFIVEDGLKLVGVALWALLMLRISAIELEAAVRRRDTSPVSAGPDDPQNRSGAASTERPPTSQPEGSAGAVAPRPTLSVEDATRPVPAHRPVPRHARSGQVPPAGPEDATTPVAVVPPERPAGGVTPPMSKPEHDRSRR